MADAGCVQFTDFYVADVVFFKARNECTQEYETDYS
jgi:hypothetical protein